MPGAPAAVSLEPPNRDIDHLTVTNGSSKADRRLLRAAAVQLRDSSGNACTEAGVDLRWSLEFEESDGSGDVNRRGVLPTLEIPELPENGVAAGRAGGAIRSKALATDAQGRAFFGDILVAEGSGRVEPSSQLDPKAPQALTCQLVLQQRSNSSDGSTSAAGSRAGAGGWRPVWRCCVVFSDDAARFKVLQELSGRREQLVKQLTASKHGTKEAARQLQARGSLGH